MSDLVGATSTAELGGGRLKAMGCILCGSPQTAVVFDDRVLCAACVRRIGELAATEEGSARYWRTRTEEHFEPVAKYGDEELDLFRQLIFRGEPEEAALERAKGLPPLRAPELAMAARSALRVGVPSEAVHFAGSAILDGASDKALELALGVLFDVRLIRADAIESLRQRHLFSAE